MFFIKDVAAGPTSSDCFCRMQTDKESLVIKTVIINPLHNTLIVSFEFSSPRRIPQTERIPIVTCW